jgi:hypothetical protein
MRMRLVRGQPTHGQDGLITITRNALELRLRLGLGGELAAHDGVLGESAHPEVGSARRPTLIARPITTGSLIHSVARPSLP